MRFRFLTDHFFAAELLGFNDFSRRAHGPAVALYPAKNPNLPIREQCSVHKRLHMDPRHTFKTTLKRVDRIQWLAAFPEEMTILVESATQKLAKASAQKSALPFWVGSQNKVLHRLFPECVCSKYPDLTEDGGWNMPCRREQGAGDLDSTLAFTSPQSTQSGWHPIIIEPDDVEDTKNSGIDANPDVRQSIINICDQNENLLRDGGYINISGTRYHPFDWYGRCIERAAMNPNAWKILIRPSLVLKDGGRLVPGEFPPEEDVELLFPEFANLSYAELAEKFYNNYEAFMCQQQNDPTGGHVSRFPEKNFNAAQIEPKRLPREGEIFICWRPRYGGNKKMAKYSEGAACRLEDGRVYVLDAWQGTYTPTGEAEKIVAACRLHQAGGLMIIAVPGSEYLMANVRNEALRRNLSVKLQWEWFEEDDSRRASAIEQMEPMINTGRLLFSTAMSKADVCRKQFVHFGLVEENGIIECISKFAGLVPISVMRAAMSEEEIEGRRSRRDNALLSQFLDQQGMDPLDEMARQKTEAHFQAMSKVSHFNMPPLPGGLDG